MSSDKEGSAGSQGPLGGAGAGVLGAGGMAGTAGASLPSTLGGPAADRGGGGASIGLAPTLASGGGGGEGDAHRGLTGADLSAREGGPGAAKRTVDEQTPMSEVGAGRGAPAGSQEVPAAGFGAGGGGRPLAGGASGGAGADLGAAGQDAGGLLGRTENCVGAISVCMGLKIGCCSCLSQLGAGVDFTTLSHCSCRGGVKAASCPATLPQVEAARRRQAAGCTERLHEQHALLLREECKLDQCKHLWNLWYQLLATIWNVRRAAKARPPWNGALPQRTTRK